jgi:Heparinase II/III-like protein/Heparinase II/III N-terminus
MLPFVTDPARDIELPRLYHTVRYLRWRQILWQLRRKIAAPRLVSVAPGPNPVAHRLALLPPISKPSTYLEGGRLKFLNHEADLGTPIDWVAEKLPLLWRYNLHYFDYLHQPSMTWATGSVLMNDWSERHRVRPEAVGWQPYPMSLRIVNWIKFLEQHAEFPSPILESLSVQAENLSRQIEFQILGNHLFSNGKALWFAGVFLQQPQWRETGRTIVLAELKEQFLPDGGHFELSPMYHSFALEDLLDLINLCHAIGDHHARAQLEPTAARSLRWLSELVDASGNFPLLNDSAHGLAPEQKDLAQYSQRLALRPLAQVELRKFDHGWAGQNLSGYWVLEQEEMRVIFDTAPLGPDYLPGHAHCDMLSVQLDFRGENILTDTGVFEYAETSRRCYLRSTAAHNTVTLDGLEQGQIWKSFRLGKRGHPRNLRISPAQVSSEHTGFAKWRRGLRHRRTLVFLQHGFEILDDLAGPAEHSFRACFHFAPGVIVDQIAPRRFQIANGIRFEVEGADTTVITTEFYPEFGLIQERPCLVLTGNFQRTHRLSVRCTSSS